MGGLGELIGYIGRVGSAYDVLLNNYFLVQIVCLIIAPAFFSAALYVTIGKLYLPNDITDSTVRSSLVEQIHISSRCTMSSCSPHSM
jgi:hypothetical protein